MTENQEFIYESIVSQIRMGFFSIDEIKDHILEEIEDNEFDAEISEDWVNEQIDNEWEKLISESKNWKSPTDTERLIEAFDELCDQNIIALHNAGFETSDGEYEVVEVERALRENGGMSDGYCFYHEQDLSRAISNEDPSLYIAFQKINNEDYNVSIEVGKKVVEVLKNHGFEVDWNGSATTKILIPNFKWQRIYDENNRDLQDYAAVVRRMTK